MQYPTPASQKGFTLLELIVVIALIGLIYALGISNFTLPKPKPKPLTPLSLKKTIAKKEGFVGTLLCTMQCKKCYMRSGLSGNFTPYANKIDLTGTTVYALDRKNNLEELEYEKYKREPICLVMHFYKNGSSTPLVLAHKEKAYFLPAYFGEAKKFDSIGDAETHWKEENELARDSGAFY